MCGCMFAFLDNKIVYFINLQLLNFAKHSGVKKTGTTFITIYLKSRAIKQIIVINLFLKKHQL